MKKEIADKWIKALRSGKYKQGKSVLHNREENTYCCLGVLAEITGCKKYDNIILTENNGVLKTSSGNLGSHISLANLNDGTADNKIRPLTFDEIADVIQMTWEEL